MTNEIKFTPPSKITLGSSVVHGRGIFAVTDIAEGELIERCPTVPLGFRSRYHSDPQIYRYLYAQPLCPCLECKNHGFILHMILGYGMMYNHKDINNTEWKFDYNNFIADLVATQDIKAGEEIFVDYGNKYFLDREKIEFSDAKNNE
jgi:hypothetical protein